MDESTAKYEVLFTFDKEKAEMYLGQSAVKVDLDTALHVLKQKDNMPDGKAWADDFPNVVNHTNAAVASHHPDFEAAKHGDFDAAIRLVDDLVKDERVFDVAMKYPTACIAYVHRRKENGINMIPAAYAAKFSAIGMDVEHNIVAINNVSHTNATDIARISRRMRFEGEVSKGKDYILLDDFITSGAELRDMRDYINSRGGNVVMMTTFGHGSYGKLNGIGIDKHYTEQLRESGITDQDLRKYGIASEIGCLTISEAAKLSRVVNARAARRAPQYGEGLQLIRRHYTAISEMAGEVRGYESTMPKVDSPIINNIREVNPSRGNFLHR